MHNYNESTVPTAEGYYAQVAEQERDVTPRRIWVPDNESDVYTPAEWRELQALARELGWRELGGNDVQAN